MNTLLKYLKPNENTKLSDLSGSDLQDFLILLDEYYLEYRDKLNLNKATFGFEIECENIKTEKIGLILAKNNLSDWSLLDDTSLQDGMEITSSILYDKLNCWEHLKKTCDILKKYAFIGNNSGGHIHVGADILCSKKYNYLNFLKMWICYENIIYRFGYGEYLNKRNSISYAKPLSNILMNDYSEVENMSLQQILSKITYGKYYAVNFSNVKPLSKFAIKNTIEFRCPNGSLNEIIWQNNVNFFIKLLLYCKSNRFDSDKIDRRINYNKNTYGEFFLEIYNEIYLDQALELSDMIFSNNLDKIYFLRQYLKDFSVCNSMVKAKTFVKNI